AAERLIRLNRLQAIMAERPAVIAAVEQAEGALATAESALADANAEDRAARAAAPAADEALRAAERTLAEVAANLERIAGRRADLDRSAALAATDHTAAAQDMASAQAAHDALPQGADTAAEVARFKTAADECRAAIGRIQTEQAMAERALAVDEDRVKSIRAEVAGWRARAGDAARRIAGMKERAEALAADLAILRDKPAALAAELATLADTAREGAARA